MTNDPQVDPAAPAAPAAEPAGSGARMRGWSGISAVAAVLALLAVAWQWHDSNNRVGALQVDLGQRLAESAQSAKETRSSADQSREAVRELQVKLGVLEARLAESQNQQIALEALYQELSSSRDEWALAEVEQILLIAAQQLQLAGNVKAALIALQTADNRLGRIDRPQLAALRKVIVKDIERLKLAPLVDVVGIAVRIDNLAASVDGLPLAMEARPAPEKPAARPEGSGTLERLLAEAWAEFRGLVRIQNVERPEVPLLAPNQTYFLRENLRLRLVSARLALLARDEATYRADLRAARDWLTRYYAMREKSVGAAAATLRQLEESRIGIELPDISASLDAVRNYKLTREKAR